MLLIKTSSSQEEERQLTAFSEYVGLERWLLLLALKVNSIAKLSGVGRILKVINAQMENTGLLLH